jgi:hypothetical protein
VFRKSFDLGAFSDWLAVFECSREPRPPAGEHRQAGACWRGIPPRVTGPADVFGKLDAGNDGLIDSTEAEMRKK